MSEKQIIFLRDWVMNFSNTLISLIRIAVLSKIKNEIKKKEASEIMIIGNGPSLNKTITEHLKEIKNKHLLCVNLFCNSEYYEKLEPKHYVVASPNMWEDNPDPRTLDNQKVLWTQIGKNTTWPLKIYLPYEAKKTKKWKNLLGNNPNIELIYFNRTPVEGFEWASHILFKMGLGMPRPHNVIIPSIFLSINLGFKMIYLIGADHSWLPETTVDDDNNVLVCQKHFYDENEAKPEGMIKIHEGSRKLHEVLEKWMFSFRSYFILKKYAEIHKAKILNATPNSYIDAFERVKL